MAYAEKPIESTPGDRASGQGLLQGRYHLLRQLGRGGATTTHLALDDETGQLCVLKCLSLERVSQWKRLELFKREARTLAHLDHPGIPRLNDYFEIQADGRLSCWLSLERVPGQTLVKLRQQGRAFDEAACIGIAVQALRILTYLHGFQPPVIHRDLKPSNLLLDEEGRVYLIDFGGVQEALAIGAGGSTIIGTFGYMAPEQFAGRALPQSDLYGLGATLVYLLSGRDPANLPQQNLLLDFRGYVECSERFAHWIEHLLLPAAEQRFAGAAEALEVLQEILPEQISPLAKLQPRWREARSDSLARHPALARRELETIESAPLLPVDGLLAAGSLLDGRYRIDAALGQGDIAVTYAARRLADEAEVVIRELHFDRLSGWKRYELFEREYQTLARLAHPALPRLLDHFRLETPDRRFYLVSERIAGASLEQKLRQGWRPLEAEVRAIAEQLLRILCFLQGLDPPLIHRDIKPSNILLDADGEVSLIDFGAVQEAFRLQGAGGSTVIGTYGYMAPEQCLGKAEPASDLYAVGATLIHLLAGRAPSELPHEALKIRFVDQVNCSRALVLWLEQMVAPSLEQRFASPAAALKMLDNLEKLPLTSARLLAQGAAILPSARDLSISEGLEGLQIALKPLSEEYRQLLVLMLSLELGGFAVLTPLMTWLAPAWLPALGMLPMLGFAALHHLKNEGQRYETHIRLDADMFSYQVLLHSGEASEIKESYHYPIAQVWELQLQHAPSANLLRINLKEPYVPLAMRRVVTNFPVASSRRKAEYVIARLNEALTYYRRQKGLN